MEILLLGIFNKWINRKTSWSWRNC